MNAVTAITAHLDAETAAIVSRLAERRGVTGGEFVAEAVRRVAESEADDWAAMQAGIDAADRGDMISDQEVMAELDAMIAKHRAKCQA